MTRSQVGLVLLLCALGCTRANPLGPSDGNVDGGSRDQAVHDQSVYNGSGADLRLHFDLAGRDLTPVCYSTCQHCLEGACCPGGKNGCCAPGEFCDDQGQCRCGSEPACAPKNPICAAGGPSQPGWGICGYICCGGIGNPCPP
jgi:hypothetical protein